MSDYDLKIALLERDKQHNEEKVKDLEKRVEKLDDIYVRISRYAIVEKIVYTLTLAVLTGVVGLALKSGALFK